MTPPAVAKSEVSNERDDLRPAPQMPELPQAKITLQMMWEKLADAAIDRDGSARAFFICGIPAWKTAQREAAIFRAAANTISFLIDHEDSVRAHMIEKRKQQRR